MASLHSNRGAKRARQARADLGYTREGPLPDLLEAVETRGGAHVVVLELPDTVAGAFIDRPGCPLLFVNGRQALSRQRFTVAHEFGHYRMGHATVIDRQETMGGTTGNPTEVAANAFAAEFLMPREAIRHWGVEHLSGDVTLEHVLLLVSEYGVSAQAARYALEGAGVLEDHRRARKLDEEIAEGLHATLAERLGLKWPDDELAAAARGQPRIPPALRNSPLAGLLAGDLDVPGLAALTGRCTEEIEAMLAELGIDQLLPLRR